MAVHKRKRNGKISWYYKFDAPGSTREERRILREFGFATKGEAQDAEAARRIEEQDKAEMAKAGSPVAAAPPKTLAMLLQEFFHQHVDVKLAPKTIERYHEQAKYLDAGLLAIHITEITPLHLNREWKRLLESGGHHRHTKAPRPLSKKTVRNVAGVVSSAFRRAVMWGLATANPVTNSEPPVPRKCRGAAITVAQTDTLIEAASGPWCMSLFLEMAVGLGARRGEVLALRWSDIVNGRAVISRTLSQTKKDLKFKPLKGHEDTEEQRVAKIPEQTLLKIQDHRQRQDAFRMQFGPDYRSDLDLIFANPDGSPLKPDSVSATVSLLFKRLKIPKPKGASLHLLRHTLASQMLDGGVPLPVVSARLGHSSIRTTAEIYSHAIHGQDDEATRRWEEYQQRNRGASTATRNVQ
ncbi:MAG TPA: site-specific integrase [Bryobacteraceae bacterium]|nr:site-specific integrase [Bryobacteraceae bacterium]